MMKKLFNVGLCIILAMYVFSLGECQAKTSDSLKKHYDFSGATAYYFGDSITIGVTTGYTLTENTYPKLFSEKVGMTYVNYAISSSVYPTGVIEHPSIEDAIMQ